MTPLKYFQDAWERCATLSQLHAFAAAHIANALRKEELLRAEWAARVSALDLYVHETVAQGLLKIFTGEKPSTAAFERFSIPNSVLMRIRNAAEPSQQYAAFDFEIRRQLSLISYQYPDAIADGIRLISSVELWKEIVLHHGSTSQTAVADAKTLKGQLKMVVDRRNKIVHEGDMQPSFPRAVWAISPQDLVIVESVIQRVVSGIEAVV
ncbi:hypothetical protein [Bordetella avium]|uniref:hypothetical protein n=1 Tax=Bordetella avium TaxID=521 RepID=UPI000FD78D53|nr:hypothetical protein [Bordetella avium]AZY53251.1 hypothetical protein C0J07_12765 [Bordetella avium]